MLNTPSFKTRLIVEQFQGNYLKAIRLHGPQMKNYMDDYEARSGR